MTLERKKEIGIFLASIVCTIGFLFSFMAIINNQDLTSLTTWVVLIALSVIWVSLYLACTIFVTTRTGSSALLAAIPPLLMLWVGNISPYVIGGAILVFILFLTLQSRLHWEMDTRTKLDFLPTFLGSTRYMFVILILALLSLISSNLVTGLTSNQGQVTIPSQFVRTVISPFDRVIEGFVPGYTATATIDQLIIAQVTQQVGSAAALSLTSDQLAVLRSQLGQKFSLHLTGQETLPDVIASLLTNYIRLGVHDNLWAALAIILISLFLSLRLLVPLLVWPTLILLQLWIALATRTGLLLRIRSEVEVERLAL